MSVSTVSPQTVKAIAKMISPTKADLVDTLVAMLIKKHGFKRVVHEVKKRQRVNTINLVLRLIIDDRFLSMNIFQFFNLDDIVGLDIAFCNRDSRFMWLACNKYLQVPIVLLAKNEIKWCKQRNIFPVILSVEGPHDNIGHMHGLGTEDSFIDDNCLISLCTKARSVTSFKLQNSDISDVGLSSFIGSCLKLDSLELHKCPHISDASMHVIGMYCGKSLKHITISHCQRLTNTGLEELLKQCPNLVSFSFSCDYHRALNSNKLLLNLGRYCQLLQSLELDYIILSNLIIDAFASGCRSVKHLYFGNIIGVAIDDFLNSIGKHCSQLEIFDIGQIYPSGTSITNYGLRTLMQGCHKLKQLIIRCPLPLISDNGFPMLSSQCPLIEVINFYSCPEKITDLTLMEFGKLKHLKEIHFPIARSSANTDNDTARDYSKPTITNEGIKQLLRCYTKTETTATTDMDVEEKEHTTSKIEKISFSINLDTLTKSSIDMIAKHCPELKSIVIYDDHDQIDRVCLVNLANTCTQLQGINMNGKVNIPIELLFAAHMNNDDFVTN